MYYLLPDIQLNIHYSRQEIFQQNIFSVRKCQFIRSDTFWGNVLHCTEPTDRFWILPARQICWKPGLLPAHLPDFSAALLEDWLVIPGSAAAHHADWPRVGNPRTSQLPATEPGHAGSSSWAGSQSLGLGSTTWSLEAIRLSATNASTLLNPC